jgi:UDP-N-acetylenolpyruvoylglucosamine reductase
MIEKTYQNQDWKPISVKAMDEMETIEELGEFLKRKVYMMKSYYEKRKSLAQSINLQNLSVKFPLLKEENIVQNIIDETPIEDIMKDVDKLRGTDKMLFSNGNYEIYFTTYEEIPSIMREIGRQRELTFRAVGEGSNLPFDLDEYDNIIITFSFGIMQRRNWPEPTEWHWVER